MGVWGHAPQENFRHTEILSIGQFCKLYTNHLYTTALGVLKERHNWALHDGSPVLDSTNVSSSAQKYSIPALHLEDSPVLEYTGSLLSVPTQPVLDVIFTKPSKEVCLINIICCHHDARARGMHACAVIYGDLCYMYKY